MSVIKNLSLRHYPGIGTLDATAVVQMVLDDIGANPVPMQAEVNEKIEDNETEGSQWFSDPDGVKGALTSLKPPPPTFSNSFGVFSYGNEPDASRKLTYTIHHYEVAPAALFYGGGHWIAVKHVQTDVDPLANSTYAIEGFWIHNPWPADPLPASPWEDVWIDYATWQTYFTPVGFVTKWLEQTRPRLSIGGNTCFLDFLLPRCGRT